MINTVAHFSDIHTRKGIERHKEYIKVFNETYNILNVLKPDRIVISGDLIHDYIETSHEEDVLLSDFLNGLSKIAKVVVIKGNHDYRKKNHNRLDSVKHLIDIMKNNDIVFYNKTGFYKDENIVWCVHNHGEKVLKAKSNPWIHNLNEKPKEQNLTYIDLFHDPVYGCSLDNGSKGTNNSYTKLSDFKGDYGFFGDIHKLQYLDKNKHFAYPSSLIQQNFGEHPTEHGFIFWNLKEDTSKFIEVHNDHRLVNLKIENNSEDDDFVIDYDNIDNYFESEYINNNTELKVFWTDKAPFINLINELKIRKTLTRLYNINNVIFEKKRIYSDIVSSKMLSDTIDINDKDNQHELFKEYLKGMNFPDEDITKILEIDDVISKRVNYKVSKNVEWSIHSVWFDNFKSYGDGNILDWFGKDGIIQINGKNQQGKTTLVDAICYVLFGTTLSTNKLGGAKTEKAGDQRYINNKRELDECSGGCVISLNGNLYTVERTTKRTWTKNKTVKGAKTDFEYYRGDVVSEENKLTGETKIKTQQLINDVLGDFSDFIRMTLINADNLNSMLSMTRADFIDSLINDAGYDIFDKKLKEFKEYKKSIDFGNLKLDPIEKENAINLLKTQNADYSETRKNNSVDIRALSEKIKGLEDLKDEKNKGIHIIEREVSELNVEELKDRLINYNNNIKEHIERQSINNEMISKLPTVFDDSKLNASYKLIQKNNEKLIDLKVNINEADNKILNYKSKYNKIDDNLEIIIQKEKQKNILKAKDIKFKNREIDDWFSDIVNVELSKIKENISEIKHETSKKSLEIDSAINICNDLDREIAKLKKEKKEQQENAFCPTCKKLWNDDDESKEHLASFIKDKDNEILEKEKIHKSNIKLLNSLTSELDITNELLKDKKTILYELENEDYTKYPTLIKKKEEKEEKLDILRKEIKSLKNINELLVNKEFDSFSDIVKKQEENNICKEKIIEDIKIIREKKDIINTEIRSIRTDINTEEKNIRILEKEKEKYNKYLTLTNEINISKLQVEKIKSNIDKFNLKFEVYNKNINFINENIKIETCVKELSKEILDLQNFMNTKEDFEYELKSSIKMNDVNITKFEKELENYKKQVKKENLYKLYENCLDRKGIPSYLLKKSIHIINEKMEHILNGINISAFINDDLQLKMSNNERLDVEMNALEASGAERTLITTALKMALRQINLKSRPNFILLDEVMGKLVENKVNEFILMLDKMKEDIEKIIIIEHIHPINYDYIINVNKDEFGVSSLVFE